MRPDEVRRTASYDSFAEECSIQLSSISVRVCHERCLAAEEYRLYTGFDHVDDDAVKVVEPRGGGRVHQLLELQVDAPWKSCIKVSF